MMWDEVMERVVAELKANPTIATLYAKDDDVAIRMANPSGEQQVPGIEWTLLGDTEGELWEPILVQFDIWFTDSTVMIQTERILRGMFRRDLPVKIGGLTLLANYEDGSMLAVPDRSNFYGRGVRFRLAALRSQYAF
jgi:hypothetical protein